MRINPVRCNTPALNSNMNEKAVSKNNANNPSFGLRIKGEYILENYFKRKGCCRYNIKELSNRIRAYEPKRFSYIQDVVFFDAQKNDGCLHYFFANDFENTYRLNSRTPREAFSEIANDYNNWYNECGCDRPLKLPFCIR